MKLSQFRKLIREEVRKIVKENTASASFYMPMVKKGDVRGLIDQVLSIDIEEEQDDLKAIAAAAKTNPEFYAKFNALLSKKIKGVGMDDDEEAPEWGPYEIKLMNKLGFSIK